MLLKGENIIPLCATIVLFIVGVVCYAAFPERRPEQPVRIMLKSTAGNVLFSHKMHASYEEGYGFDCIECHHLWEEDLGEKPLACGECHLADNEEEYMPGRSDAFHLQCQGCHEDFGSGPVQCSDCHVR
jgi:hypothetical protein